MDGRLLELAAVPGRALRAIAVAGRGGCVLPELAALVGGALLGLRLWLCLVISFFVRLRQKARDDEDQHGASFSLCKCVHAARTHSRMCMHVNTSIHSLQTCSTPSSTQIACHPPNLESHMIVVMRSTRWASPRHWRLEFRGKHRIMRFQELR